MNLHTFISRDTYSITDNSKHASSIICHGIRDDDKYRLSNFKYSKSKIKLYTKAYRAKKYYKLTTMKKRGKYTLRYLPEKIKWNKQNNCYQIIW